MNRAEINEADHRDQWINILKLNLSDQLILIDLYQVHIILPIMELQTIPTQNKALNGVLNYHGQPVYVYHLCPLINSQQIEYNMNSLFLLSSTSSGLVGFTISEHIDIIRINKKHINPPNPHDPLPYITGLVENKDLSGWILDLEKLLLFHQLNTEESHA